MKKLVILLSIFLVNQFAFAQKGHEIKGKIKGAVDGTTVYLAHYFGATQYIKKDSAVAKNGELLFKGTEPIPGGMYLLVLSRDRYYEMVLNEQNFSFESDTADFVENFKTTSTENGLFYELQRFIKSKSTEANTIQQMAKLRGDQMQDLMARKRLAEISKEIATYKADFVKKNEKTLVAKFINVTIEPELPKVLPLNAQGKPDSSWLFYRYKENFFKNIDFTDDNMVRTPFLQKSIDRYMKELTLQSPDSVIKEADFILAKAEPNKEIFRYCLWYITSQYENSNIVGLEPVFIHLADKYYLSGKANWLDSAATAKFQQRINTMRPLLPGLVFPELIGSDSLGREININKLKSKYTVVVFYADDCGHCKDAAPKLVEFYKTAKEKGIEVVLVDVLRNEAEWRKYIGTYKVGKMVNIWEPKMQIDFKERYDAYTTPTTYVLDENKKIIGKKLPVEELGKYIDFVEKRNAALKN